MEAADFHRLYLVIGLVAGPADGLPHDASGSHARRTCGPAGRRRRDAQVLDLLFAHCPGIDEHRPTDAQFLHRDEVQFVLVRFVAFGVFLLIARRQENLGLLEVGDQRVFDVDRPLLRIGFLEVVIVITGDLDDPARTGGSFAAPGVVPPGAEGGGVPGDGLGVGVAGAPAPAAGGGPPPVAKTPGAATGATAPGVAVAAAPTGGARRPPPPAWPQTSSPA